MQQLDKNGTASPLPFQLFQDRPVTFKECKNVNELSELFCQAVNPGRTQAGYKPYTIPRMNHLLQHLDLNDRKLFFASCEDANNFGKYFHYAIKVRV